MPVLSRCTCGADCEFTARGDCDGRVKVIGYHGTDDTWIHACHAHRLVALSEHQDVTLFPDVDWSRVGPA